MNFTDTIGNMCAAITKDGRVYYKCACPVDFEEFGDYKLEKAIGKLMKHLFEMEKSVTHRVLFPPSEDDVEIDEPVDMYYDRAVAEVLLDNCHYDKREGLYVCRCPFDGHVTAHINPKIAEKRMIMHIENTPKDVDMLEQVATYHHSRASKEAEKANYKNGNLPLNYFNEYHNRQRVLTKPDTPNLVHDHENKRRSREYEHNRGREKFFIGKRRRASTHRFGGESASGGRRSTSDMFQAKANYGNYGRKHRKKGERGNDSSSLSDPSFPQITEGVKGTIYSEILAVLKEVNDNQSESLPGRTIPYYTEKPYKQRAPQVNNAHGIKPKSRKRENLLTDAKILSVDQAGQFAHN
jgi:hypothetical protein